MVNRILLLLKEKNISVSQFADLIEVQRSSMSHIISGRNKPSLDFILKIFSKFPEINVNWLLFGEGELYKNNHKTEKLNFDIINTDVIPIDSIKSNSNENSEFVELSENKFDENINKNNSISNNIKKNIDKEIDKVLIFYNDKTFAEYKPE